MSLTTVGRHGEHVKKLVWLIALDGYSTTDCLVGVMIGAPLRQQGYEVFSKSTQQILQEVGGPKVHACVIVAGLPPDPTLAQVEDFLLLLQSTGAASVPTVVLTTGKMSDQDTATLIARNAFVVPVEVHKEHSVVEVVRHLQLALEAPTTS